jgi:hypothetical protein
MTANGLGQRASYRARFALLAAGKLRLLQPFLNHLLFLGAVGKAKRGAVDHLDFLEHVCGAR